MLDLWGITIGFGSIIIIGVCIFLLIVMIVLALGSEFEKLGRRQRDKKQENAGGRMGMKVDHHSVLLEENHSFREAVLHELSQLVVAYPCSEKEVLLLLKRIIHLARESGQDVNRTGSWALDVLKKHAKESK